MSGIQLGDPFGVRSDVRVAGGRLRVARTELAPDEAGFAVLAVHGVASSHMTWRPTARALAGRSLASVLAPDLRGRGGSAGLPGPYGLAAHVADMLAVLDDAGVDRAVLVGHSLGAYVVCGLAAAHPERVTGVVLVDGGLALPGVPAEFADELVDAMVAGALEYAHGTYASPDAFVAMWRTHPAFAADWTDDVDAYLRYELDGEPGAVRSVVSAAAVRADLDDLMRNDASREAIDRVRAPIRLLTAARGMHNDGSMLPGMFVDTFAATHPAAYVERIPDVNHYTVLLGGGNGPARVADAIMRDWSSARPASG